MAKVRRTDSVSLGARGCGTVERAEDAFQLCLGDARPVITDLHLDTSTVVKQGHLDWRARRAVLFRVAQEVAQDQPDECGLA